MDNDTKAGDSYIPDYIDHIFDLISDGIYISDRHGREIHMGSDLQS
jgi:hypothetical protein